MALESGEFPATSYRRELDGIRGIAILCVMAFHAFLVGIKPRFAGFMGVDMFFVLSGYLITTLLLQEKRATLRIDLRSFYARRGLRLLPGLLVMLALAGVLVVTLGRRAETTAFEHSLPFVILYAGNWLPHTFQYLVVSHTWSLAIEEQFYLCWPPILLFCLRRRVSARNLTLALLALALGLAAISSAFGALHHAGVVPRVEGVVVDTYVRAFGVLVGCVIAIAPRLFNWTRNSLVAWCAIAGAVVLMGIRSAKTTFHYEIGIVAFTILVAVVLGHVVHRPSGFITRALRLRPLAAIGKVSYGLYLFHVPLFWYIGQSRLVPLGYPSLVVALAATVAVTMASYAIVERPALRLKERFRRRTEPEIVDERVLRRAELLPVRHRVRTLG